MESLITDSKIIDQIKQDVKEACNYAGVRNIKFT